ncbi:hypothetical protein D3C83_144670 [compost metagenome]
MNLYATEVEWFGFHCHAGNVARDQQVADLNRRAIGVDFHLESRPVVATATLPAPRSPSVIPGCEEITPATRVSYAAVDETT